MNDAAYVLGVGIGTTGARVGIFDLKGNPIVFCSENFPLYTPASGRAEQDANDWWEAVCKASKKAVATAKIDPATIRGMSLDTTCCTVLLSGDDMVPLQNAILWMDVRASEQAKRIYQSGHDALKYNGYSMVSAECLPAKALWIKENQPELWNKATRFYECTDWLTYKLTGKYTASINCASARWYYNAAEGGYPVDFYEKIGLEDLVQKLPAQVLSMGDFVGGLTEEAARDMGLQAGIPVGEGGADAFVGVIGLNAVQPGKMALITGSSHLHVAQVAKEIHTKGIWGSYPDIQTAAENMTSVDYVIEPDARKHEQYQFYYGKYKEFYQLAKDWMHQVTTYNTKHDGR